ncbi:MAG: hypothetical protein Q8L16_18720 [Hydrogenophaga sp.]|nr:hypothetical protein [Hydrogenophaga sp.]
MNHRNNFTGQWADSRDHNDNAPARYSAPSATFKEILARKAKNDCRNCNGTGYLGRYKHVCAGRCFKCIPGEIMAPTEGAFDLTCEARGCDEMAEIYLAVCSDGGAGPAYLSDGMWITPEGQTYDAADSMGPMRNGRFPALRSACLLA